MGGNPIGQIPHNSIVLMKHLLRTILPACALLASVAGCSSDVEDYYAHERAFLRFTPVTAIHPLYTALNNPGMFCQITIGTRTYEFKGTDGTTGSYPLTALENYGKPECIAGFVVGIPSTYDMNMQQRPVAYDLACPTCYEENMLQRSLSFSGPEELTCLAAIVYTILPMACCVRENMLSNNSTVIVSVMLLPTIWWSL